MANMLIRTTRVRGKFRAAIVLRVVLFFGIPFIYFLFARLNSHLQSVNDTSGHGYETFTSRHLLALGEKASRNCTPAAILEFPSDGLTRMQRKSGFVIVHCVLAVYCFLLLGTVCEQYFVPAIEMICDRLDLESDVTGATFMAAASSSPELFINCVGTFVTEGDLGIGAIVGSAVFNVLAVPACCALATVGAIELDWWSVSRDCLMYAIAVFALIFSLLDNVVHWYEALLLVLMYTLYIIAMVFNGRLGRFVRSGCCYYKKPKLYTEITPLLIKDYSVEDGLRKVQTNNHINDSERDIVISKRNSTDSDSSYSSLLSWPGEKTSGVRKALWFCTWPISVLLWTTVPDCRRRPALYPLTFALCIVWIGGVSYLVAWIITTLGDTLDIPDSITGLTILAAGTSLPEAVSSVLVTSQGRGTMGMSNSIGSNTFDILLCLGLPWLIKSLFYPSIPGMHVIIINSGGLSYSAISLLTTLFCLYFSLALNKFRLDWKIGIVCVLIYIGFLVIASLIELNVLFVVNPPVCPH